MLTVCKAPMRISFLGGGTDYPEYLETNLGFVVGSAIDQYVWRVVEDGEVSVGASVEGTCGLGASSAATVCEVGAECDVEGDALVSAACSRERDRRCVGVQDHTFAVHGRLGAYEFFPNGKLYFHPLMISTVGAELERNLLVLDTGQRRPAECDQLRTVTTTSNIKHLDQLRALATAGYNLLRNGLNVRRFAELVDRSWRIKRDLADGVTSPLVDNLYADAVLAGAWGGKLCGAGGGGFLMLLVPPDRREAVKEDLGLVEMRVRLNAPGFTRVSVR